MSIAEDRVTIVTKTAFFGVVGEAFLKELGFGGCVMAKGAFFPGAVGQTGMRFAAAEAAAERAWMFAFAFCVGAWVNWVFISGRGGRGLGGRAAALEC